MTFSIIHADGRLLKIGIARGISEEDLIPAFEACAKGGFTCLEVTMNTQNALRLIRKAADHFAQKRACDTKVFIGAGTVTTFKEMKCALNAGAEFIVSPNTDVKIIRYCAKYGIPVFPGALTPTEIFQAWEAGASMVKIFPVAAMGGASYVKHIKAPFDKIKILASGGVTPENLADYVKNGTDAIAIGSQLFNTEWLKRKEYGKITEAAMRFDVRK